MGFEPGNPINAIWYRPGPIILLWAYGRMNLWTVEGGQCTDVFGHLYMYEGSKPQLPNECPADEKSTTVKNATIINAAGSRNLKATRNWFWWRLWGNAVYCIVYCLYTMVHTVWTLWLVNKVLNYRPSLLSVVGILRELAHLPTCLLTIIILSL